MYGKEETALARSILESYAGSSASGEIIIQNNLDFYLRWSPCHSPALENVMIEAGVSGVRSFEAGSSVPLFPALDGVLQTFLAVSEALRA